MTDLRDELLKQKDAALQQAHEDIARLVRKLREVQNIPVCIQCKGLYPEDWKVYAIGEFDGKLILKCPVCMEEQEHVQQDFRNVACPKCAEVFHLRWKDYDGYVNQETTPVTLEVRSCQSGGVYRVNIECPHCGHEEDV